MISRFKSPLPLLPILLAGAFAAAAHGEMTISGNATKPGDVRVEFDATDDTGNITIFHRGTGAFRQAGQAFTVAVPKFSLHAVSFKVWEAAPETRGKRCSLKLFRVANPGMAPDPTHDLLFSENGILPEAIDPQQYLTFQLETPYTLEEGASYLLLLGFEEPTSSDNHAKSLGLERTNANAQFGRLWIYNGESFASDRKTLLFSLHGTDAQ